MKSPIALASFVYFVLISFLSATIVDLEPMTCPSCAKEYEHSVIVSWNYGISNGADPPAPSGCCPYCLYQWKGKKEKLDEVSRKRQRRGVSLFRKSFREKDRARLLAKLNFNDAEFSTHLSQWGEWARGELNKPRVLPVEFYKPERVSWFKKRFMRKQAIRFLTEIKETKPSLAELQKKLKKEIILGYVDDWLGADTPEASAVFFTLLLHASEEKLRDSSYAFLSIADKLRLIPRDKWPSLPASNKRIALTLESLKYLKGERAWGRDFDNVLLNTKRAGLANWLLACATSRRDHAPSRKLNGILKVEKYWVISERFAAFYLRCGKASDLPLIENAHKYWLNISKKHRQWEIGDTITPELDQAMVWLRIRLILQGYSPRQ